MYLVFKQCQVIHKYLGIKISADKGSFHGPLYALHGRQCMTAVTKPKPNVVTTSCANWECTFLSDG